VYNWGIMATMIRTNIFLTPSQRQKLAQESAETGAPVGAIIRRAIDSHLAGRRGPGRRKEMRRGK